MNRVLAVELALPGLNEDDFIYSGDNRSLSDGELILFSPDMNTTTGVAAYEQVAHWRREIIAACMMGRTIFVFCSRCLKLSVEGGTYGPMPDVTNYQMIPFSLTPITVTGQFIKLAPDSAIISNYWKHAASLSSYEVYFQATTLKPLMLSKDGAKVVGAVARVPNSPGHIVLLPNLHFPDDKYTKRLHGEDVWTQEAITLGKGIINELLAIDRSLRAQDGITPPPAWVGATEYAFKREHALTKIINDLSAQQDSLTKQIADAHTELGTTGTLRRLLYETGHPLEHAVIEALHLLGFKASRFQEGQSEFDAVFTSPEGRFLGEAEGKDNTPVNIDKCRQLESNILEDLDRADVTTPAKGVLFGNAYRLLLPNDRRDYFTEKCMRTAERRGYALVRTPDLFIVARYLKEHDNLDFAAKCRKAILDSSGTVVVFPSLPPQRPQRSKPIQKLPRRTRSNAPTGAVG